MTIENRACDLCSLPVEVAGYQLMTCSGPKHFCCEGCQGIYQMLHADEIVTGDANDAAPAAPPGS